MDTEHEYEKWFEEKLGDFESLYQNEKDNIFWYSPKKFSFIKWIMLLIFSIIAFLLLAYFLDYYKINFWSNVALSMSTGCFVNLIFLIITTSKEKYICYYNSLIPILEKRREQLSNAYYDCNPYFTFAFQENNKDKWYFYWHRLINMSCVAINFHQFLIKCLPNDYIKKDDLQSTSDKLTLLNNKAFALCVNKDKTIDFKELHENCEKEIFVIFNIIISLDNLIDELKIKLYKKTYRS